MVTFYIHKTLQETFRGMLMLILEFISVRKQKLKKLVLNLENFTIENR